MTIPVTAVSGSPALKVSTVAVFHATPTFCLIRSTIPRAVGRVVAGRVAGDSAAAAVAPASPKISTTARTEDA